MSMTTMLSSTTMPSTTRREARVTVLISKPRTYIIPKEINMVMGIAVAATEATLRGNITIITAITARMAMSISLRKE